MYKILYVTGLIVEFLPKFSYVLFWLNNDRKSGTIVNVVISRRCNCTGQDFGYCNAKHSTAVLCI